MTSTAAVTGLHALAQFVADHYPVEATATVNCLPGFEPLHTDPADLITTYQRLADLAEELTGYPAEIGGVTFLDEQGQENTVGADNVDQLTPGQLAIAAMCTAAEMNALQAAAAEAADRFRALVYMAKRQETTA